MKKQPRVALMYHDVFENDAFDSGFQNRDSRVYKVSKTDFEHQINSIANWLNHNKLPLDSVEVTFDDGGDSAITLAAPILEKHGMRGVFFVATDYVDTPHFLTVSQIRDLSRRGHIIGSHSATHPDNMAVMSHEDLSKEWSESMKKLEEWLPNLKGHFPASIPNGYESKAVFDVMADAGYERIYTSNPTTHITTVNNIPIIGRYVVLSTHSTDFVKSIIASSATRTKLQLRHRVLGFAKFCLGPAYMMVRKCFLPKNN